MLGYKLRVKVYPEWRILGQDEAIREGDECCAAEHEKNHAAWICPKLALTDPLTPKDWSYGGKPATLTWRRRNGS
jgi:hypothetical protein